MTLEDQADAATELFLSLALSKRQKETPKTGLCLYCKAPVGTARAFCDENCRKDFEWLTKKR